MFILSYLMVSRISLYHVLFDVICSGSCMHVFVDEREGDSRREGNLDLDGAPPKRSRSNYYQIRYSDSYDLLRVNCKPSKHSTAN